MRLLIFILFFSSLCNAQPDVLFEQYIENKSVISVPDTWDSTLLVKVIQNYPSSYQSLYARALFAFSATDAELCQRLTDTLIQGPMGMRPYGFILKGLLAEAMGDPLAALAMYNRSLQSSPGFLMALAHRGLLNYQMDNLFAAENDFNTILKIRGDDPDFLLNLAAVKLAQNDLDASFELFKRVADGASGNASLLSESYSGMAHVKLLAFEYQESINLYQNAIRYDPQNAVAYYEMGLTKKYLKDNSGACQDLMAAKNLGYKVTRKELKGCR